MRRVQLVCHRRSLSGAKSIEVFTVQFEADDGLESIHNVHSPEVIVCAYAVAVVPVAVVVLYAIGQVVSANLLDIHAPEFHCVSRELGGRCCLVGACNAIGVNEGERCFHSNVRRALECTLWAAGILYGNNSPQGVSRDVAHGINAIVGQHISANSCAINLTNHSDECRNVAGEGIDASCARVSCAFKLRFDEDVLATNERQHWPGLGAR